jgi:hypothetical protein
MGIGYVGQIRKLSSGERGGRLGFPKRFVEVAACIQNAGGDPPAEGVVGVEFQRITAVCERFIVPPSLHKNLARAL